jgi:lipoprotein-releasing system permease protein
MLLKESSSVGGDYKWDNIKEYLVEGKLPDFSKS